MPTKIDFKKDFKHLYMPSQTPTLVDVPTIKFIAKDGHGDPNSELYKLTVGALYALSYAIKMGKEVKQMPDFFDYVVPPLEGLWWSDGAFDLSVRDNWLWTSMIRVPDFISREIFDKVLTTCKAKKPEIDFTGVRLEEFSEGLCVQMMHVGPYATEPESMVIMKEFMASNNLIDEVGAVRKHHEIYLGDPRKTEPDKLKTVLRHPVRYANE